MIYAIGLTAFVLGICAIRCVSRSLDKLDNMIRRTDRGQQ